MNWEGVVAAEPPPPPAMRAAECSRGASLHQLIPHPPPCRGGRAGGGSYRYSMAVAAAVEVGVQRGVGGAGAAAVRWPVQVCLIPPPPTTSTHPSTVVPSLHVLLRLPPAQSGD